MPALLLDTHAVLWYLADSPELSPKASAAIRETLEEGGPAFVSSISHAEAIYLSEKGRIPKDDYEKLLTALSEPDSELTVIPFSLEHAASMSKVPRSVVPDMPDRMITATAVCLSIRLVTRDTMIRSLPGLVTIW
jgi:PIN domain nuclease of toxin-antitoxin system